MMENNPDSPPDINFITVTLDIYKIIIYNTRTREERNTEMN